MSVTLAYKFRIHFHLLLHIIYFFVVGCHNLPIIWLYKEGGFCLTAEDCLKLQNCTTLYGNLIIRTTQNQIKDDTKLVKADFPKLREVTGYVLIVFHHFETFDLLPSLSVIRGKHLVSNYAFIVYLNELKGIYFPNLTTILHGGVRIERNSRLCYADVIRWKSIVKVNLHILMSFLELSEGHAKISPEIMVQF